MFVRECSVSSLLSKWILLLQKVEQKISVGNKKWEREEVDWSHAERRHPSENWQLGKKNAGKKNGWQKIGEQKTGEQENERKCSTDAAGMNDGRWIQETEGRGEVMLLDTVWT